jgi:ribosomal protein L18
MVKCFRKNTKFRILVRKTNRYFYASLISPDGHMKFSKSTMAYSEKSYNCKSVDFIKKLGFDFSEYLKSNDLFLYYVHTKNAIAKHF